MSEVLLINPTKRRRKRTTKKKPAKKRVKRRSTTKAAAPRRRKTTRKRTTRRAAPKRTGVSTMAKRKRTYKRKPARKNPTRRRRSPARRNPSKAYSRARSTFMGLNIPQALKDQIPMLAGMMGAKWMAKRFDPAASETDPGSWNWSSYLKAGLGAVATAIIAQNIKRGTGQKVLSGGLAYVSFKLVQNELIADSTWWSGQFGAEDDYVPDEYAGAGYVPGDVEYSGGQGYLLGEDEQWRELPSGYSGQADLRPVGRLGADYTSPLEPVGPLGNDAAYVDALLDN